MSTRIYPLYQRGNPQLRVFLPNFWMKVVKAPNNQRNPPNVVNFHVSPEMTKLDVKNYLEKIYKLPVVNVRTFIAGGHTHESLPSWRTDQTEGYFRQKGTASLYKDDDVKMVRVTFPTDFKFEHPEVTKNPKEKPEEESMEKRAKSEIAESKRIHKESVGVHAKLNRKGAPSFFGL